MLPNCTHVSFPPLRGDAPGPAARQETGSRFGAAAGLVVAVNDFMRFVKVTVVLLLQPFVYANVPLGRSFSLASRFVRVRVNSLVANSHLAALSLEHQGQSVGILAECLHIEAPTT